jgi:hypothetical protein
MTCQYSNHVYPFTSGNHYRLCYKTIFLKQKYIYKIRLHKEQLITRKLRKYYYLSNEYIIRNVH